jgi:antirestriction protein ArdC
MENITSNTEKEKNSAAVSCLAIVQQAISKPGLIHDAYHRFHGYSLRNQLLAMFQCASRGIAPGPLATYRGWERLGRHVLRGEKALVLCVPITLQDIDNDAIAEHDPKIIFVFRSRWFVLSQTEGESYEPVDVPTWSTERALQALGVKIVRFDHPDGNVQGYATPEGNIAINPVAALPHKTLFHELAHIMLDHAKDETVSRSLREVEAEGVALFCCEALDLEGAVYARGYLQHWLGREALTEASAQRIISTTHQILNAGDQEETPPPGVM